MINITPETDADSQVTVGDKVRVSCLLDAQVDRSDLTITLLGSNDQQEANGPGAILEEEVHQDGNILFRYAADFVLTVPRTRIQIAVDDPVNALVDTAQIAAEPNLT